MGATQTAAPRREPLRRDPTHRLRRAACAPGSARHLASTRSSCASRSWRRPPRAAWAIVALPARLGVRARRRRRAGASAWARRLRTRPRRRSRSPSGSGLADAGLPADHARARALVLRRDRLAARARWPRAPRCSGASRSRRRRRVAGARAARRRPRRSAASAPQRACSRNGAGRALVIAAGVVFLAAHRRADAPRATSSSPCSSSPSCSGSSSRRGPCGSCARWPPSAPSASARRSAPRWPRTCTTRCCRRSRSCRSAPTTRARSPRWPAARSASCARGWPARDAAADDARSPPRSRRRPARSSATTACRSRSSRSATRALDERGEALVAAAREAMVNAAKFGGGSPVDVYAEVADDALAGLRARPRPGLRPGRRARRPARRARVDRRAHGRATAGAPTIHSAPGRGHRGRADDAAGTRMTRVVDRRRPRALPRRRARRARRAASTSSARPRRVEDAVRADRRARSPTSCCSTSTCPTAAASR